MIHSMSGNHPHLQRSYTDNTIRSVVSVILQLSTNKSENRPLDGPRVWDSLLTT